jgi:drug/metabolite transporter (DMT)-like permease
LSAAEAASTRAPARPLEGPSGVLLSAVCYGLNAAPAREASGLGVAGADLAVARNLLLFSGVAGLALAKGVSLRVPRASWPALIGLGVASAGVGVSYMSAVAFVPVGVAVMIFYTYPALIAATTPFVDGRRLSPAALGAFGLATVGVLLTVAASPAGLDWRGLALAALASLSAALQLFCAARAPGGGGLATVFWAQAIMLPIGLALLFVVGYASPADWARAGAPAAMTMALYMAAFALQTRGMKRASAAASSVIYCLEPIVATGFAALWLGERLSGLQYLGAALAIAGVALEIASRGAPTGEATRRSERG